MDTKPITRPDPWIAFTDALTRRAEAAEQALAAMTAERDAHARDLAQAIAVIEHVAPRPWEANLDDPHNEQDSGEYDDEEWVITDAFEREIDRVGPSPSEPGHGVWARDYVATVNALGTAVRPKAQGATAACASDPDDGVELDDDDAAVWEVATGTGTATAIAGYNTGDQRGLVALHFAQDDEAGWCDGQYIETLWVRRCKPDPEPEPGQAIRVVVSRDPTADPFDDAEPSAEPGDEAGWGDDGSGNP